MSGPRIIARLDIKNNTLIKGVCFEGLRVLGDPCRFARKYYLHGLDELFFVDAVASLYNRNNLADVIQAVTESVFVPVTVGGGIRTVEDAKVAFNHGADKVAINTEAVKNPDILKILADKFGSQSVVLSVQAKRRNGWWEVMTESGREKTGKDVFEWIRGAQENGVGEVYLSSVDQDGTGQGFDQDLIAQASTMTALPLVAGGGMGNAGHFEKIISYNVCDGIAIGSALHYQWVTCKEMKELLAMQGHHSRLTEVV